MQRALRRYAAAMYGAYDDEKPATGELVYRALLPILTFRERLLPANGKPVDEDQVLDELEAELAQDLGSEPPPIEPEAEPELEVEA